MALRILIHVCELLSLKSVSDNTEKVMAQKRLVTLFT